VSLQSNRGRQSQCAVTQMSDKTVEQAALTTVFEFNDEDCR